MKKKETKMEGKGGLLFGQSSYFLPHTQRYLWTVDSEAQNTHTDLAFKAWAGFM